MGIHLRSLDSGHLQSKILTDRWCFLYCHTGNAWKGELSKAEVASSASELNQDFNDYIETATKIFSNENCQDVGIELTDCENNNKELTWKKITSTSVKYSLGSVVLEKCDASEIDGILTCACNAISHLKQKLSESHSEQSNIKAENINLVCRLEDFSKLKVELEGELFTKFVLILNEKKAKIRELKQEIEKVKKQKSLPQSPTLKVSDVVTKPLVQEEPQSKKLKSETKPQTISHDNSLTEDSEELVRKIPKRERRHQQQIFPSVIPSTSRQIPKLEEPADPSTSMVNECDDTVDASEMLDGL